MASLRFCSYRSAACPYIISRACTCACATCIQIYNKIIIYINQMIFSLRLIYIIIHFSYIYMHTYIIYIYINIARILLCLLLLCIYLFFCIYCRCLPRTEFPQVDNIQSLSSLTMVPCLSHVDKQTLSQ